jgi:hypothetical protein
MRPDATHLELLDERFVNFSSNNSERVASLVFKASVFSAVEWVLACVVIPLVHLSKELNDLS